MAIYKYTLTDKKIFSYLLPTSIFNNINFFSSKIVFEQKEMGEIFINQLDDKTYVMITIFAGYSWDGCTPKFKTKNGNIIGTWDGLTNAETMQTNTYTASLLHDFLLQFYDQHPLSVYTINKLFFKVLKENNFIFSRIYYYAVTFYFYLRSLKKLDIKQNSFN